MSDVTSKSWRKDPKVQNAEVKFLVMAPFAVVAYINKGNYIHVGVSRCNPEDTFNEDRGSDTAANRARLQYASKLGLIPDRRVRALARRAEGSPNPYMMTLTKTQFKARFNTNP